MSRWRQTCLAVGLAALASVAAVPALAQPVGAPGPGPGGVNDPKVMLDRQMTVLTERLALSGEQQPKVRAILEEAIQRNREIRQKYRPEPGTPPAPELRDEMAKVRKDTRTKLADVLTPEQLAAYDTWDEERRQRPGGPGGPGRPGGPPGPGPGDE